MNDEWTAAQCADEWGIKVRTWHGYVARNQAPKPARHVGRTPVWDAEAVKTYPRPGRGARTDLKETTVLYTEKLADQIRTTLGDRAADFDVDAIVEEIGDTYGRNTVSVDAIPSEEYWAIVEKHDQTA